MAIIDSTYFNVVNEILTKGYFYEDPNRNGVMRKEIPSYTFTHDLENDGFPALTTKQIFFKGAVAELLFFMSGSTDIRTLWSMGVHFWDKDYFQFTGHRYFKDIEEAVESYKVMDDLTEPEPAYDMGKIYPYQYRNRNVDQIVKLVQDMKSNPMSTSLKVNTWNQDDFDQMCLKPCHDGFTIICYPRNKKMCFELHWSQRSCDFFLGIPLNMVYYAVLAKILEKETGMTAVKLQGDLKNVHLYDNQLDAVKRQLKNSPMRYEESNLVIEDTFDFESFLKGKTPVKSYLDMFKLENYESFPKISVEMLAYSKNNI